MKKLIMAILMILLILPAITANEKEEIVNDVCPLTFKGVEGFFITKFLMQEYEKDVNYKETTWTILGLTEKNFESQVKKYALADGIIKALIAVIIILAGIIVSVGIGIASYIIIKFADTGIILNTT